MEKDKKRTNAVFLFSAAIAVAIAVWGIVARESFAAMAGVLMGLLKQKFSWLYLGVMLLFVIFSLALAFSRFGKIRLGADGEKPEYSNISWFAMLFGAGMGIGLVFWGVAEPLSHYAAPMKGIEPQTEEAARFAIRSCFMHWGLHPWACYAVMGLGLAYFQFRKNSSALASSLLKPLFGEKRAAGLPGKTVDIFTTALTVTGVATSFGMGCLQISSGLKYLFSIPDCVVTWLVIIVLISILYLMSAVSGVEKGIKRLSDLNMAFFILLMIAAFFIGPTLKILGIQARGLLDYLTYLVPDSLRLSSQGDSQWIQDWRVFYWAWWLSWAPFVGVFIARISRGRTIREFVLGVIIVPTAVSMVWFSIFGGISLHAAGNFSSEKLAELTAAPQTALFHVFDQYRVGIVLSLIALTLLITFFVTSANSATFVLAMLTSDGQLDPPNHRKIFWGVLMAVVAFALILSGGISVIQTVSIIIAFPYLFILILIGISLVKELKKEPEK